VEKIFHFSNLYSIFAARNDKNTGIMAIHNQLGHEGEAAAADFLQRLGYRILHRNWRSGHKELDIVAQDGDMLVVVEVKTRTNEEFGRPDEAVTPMKIRRITLSADAYVREFEIDLPVRFDVLSVEGTVPPFVIRHIQDAFYPPIG
jgi:putative endonuclease